MAYSSKYQNGSLVFKPDSRHFISIIGGHDDPISLHNNLAIPSKIVQFYGDDLPSRVMLKVPSGAKWEVEIVRSRSNNGEIWLQNGWGKFAKYYSLAEGFLLCFEYDEKSAPHQFNVVILDNNMTEIDYAFSPNNNGDASHQRTNNQERRVPHRESKKEQVAVEEPNRESDSDSDCVEIIFPSSTRRFQLNQNGQAQGKQTVKSTKKPCKPSPRASVKVEYENPTFHFKMKLTHVNSLSNLDIPVKFARQYMEMKDGVALLKVSDVRTWPVKYYTITTSGQIRTKFAASSWKYFVLENHLEVGDVCKFELIDPHEIVFRVTISRFGSSSGPASNGERN